MPELPEVETIRRHLAPRVEGRVLTELDIEDPRWCEPLTHAELHDDVEHRVVEKLGRRGKYLVGELADQALFRARVHPLRPAGSLKRAQYDELAAAVQEVLAAGIDAGGASIDDFRHPDGVSGAFQNGFLVHLRRGESCVRCGSEIVKF